MPRFSRGLRRGILSALLAGSAIAAAPGSPLQPQTASIEIDAGIAGPISPLLYGQFVEFMFEGIKGGVHAELIRNRSFEEPRQAVGLSRYWERYPDDRNDDYAISFGWDAGAAYPDSAPGEGLIGGHSLRVELGDGVITRHGVHQARMPVRPGRRLSRLSLAQDRAFTGERTRRARSRRDRRTDLRRGAHRRRRRRLEAVWVHPEAGEDDPLARFAILFSGVGQRVGGPGVAHAG